MSLMKRTLLALFLVGCGSAENVDSTGENRGSIVGGTATSSFPAVGALTKNGSPFCSGTLIAPRKVATAAHCLSGMGVSGMRFAFGPNAFSPTSSIAIVAIQPHPQYNAQSITNDIGVA